MSASYQCPPVVGFEAEFLWGMRILDLNFSTQLTPPVYEEVFTLSMGTDTR